MNGISHAYHAAKLALKVHAPTIMVTTGVVAMGASVVTASKQTLKLEEVLSKHTPVLEEIDKTKGLFLEDYSESDAAQDRGKVYARAGFDLAKLYAVPGVLFIGGSCLVFGGHRILLKRNATLALAFTALKETFDRYRARVKDTFGAEADQAMYGGYNVVGKGTKTEHPERDWEEAGKDPYNRVFSQFTSTQFEEDLGLNKMFIDTQRRFAQERCNRQGYLYLSDVYKALGFEETPLSRVVGWKVTRNPDTGEKIYPHVDFGLDTAMPDDWTYSVENEVYLDFNCQGLIIGGDIQRALERA